MAGMGAKLRARLGALTWEKAGNWMAEPEAQIAIAGGAVVCFFLWASVASVDEIVRAPGELVPTQPPQVVQNLEGGIISEILVSEGDVVAADQVLIRLHDTMYRSALEDLEDRITALEIRKARLEAEELGTTEMDISPEIAAHLPNLAASERALLLARLEDFETEEKGRAGVAEQVRKELEIMERLAKRKIVSQVELVQARKAYQDAQLRYKQSLSETRHDRADQHTKTVSEIIRLQHERASRLDQLQRTEMRAASAGVVNTVFVNTVGGVVRPGERILQVTPLDGGYVVEAKVAPKDIAGVRPGQEVTIKLSAYDYTIFGSLKGRVGVVSADSFKEETRAGEEAYYKVSVVLDPERSPRQERIDLRPGMQAQVELHTGSKTILRYLLKPIFKANEAFREP